jgi:uncharacterized Fe-S cluster-containing MiaB family protein
MISGHQNTSKQIEKTVVDLLDSGAWKAALILSPTEVVRVTRRRYRKQKAFDNKRLEVMVTVGRPNYIERAKVADCKKRKESFPVTILKFAPVSR